MQDVSRLHTKDDAFESLESPDQQSLSRLRRLAPNAGQELLERSMREAVSLPNKPIAFGSSWRPKNCPCRGTSTQSTPSPRIERNDPRFPDRLRRLLDARDRLANLPSNVSGREYQGTAAGPIDARTAAWSAWPKRCLLLLISCTDPKETRHGTVLQSNQSDL